MWAMGESGVSFSAVLMCLSASVALATVGQAANHRADLADDLGVVKRHGGVRFGVLGRQLERGVQGVADLAGDAGFQRLGDAQALAVAAQGERVAVVAVGFVRQRLDGGFGQFRGLFETIELFRIIVHQVGGVDAQSLDRHAGADRTEFFAGIEGRLEVAVMESPPGLLQCRGQPIGIEPLGRRLAAAAISAAARLASGKGSTSPACNFGQAFFRASPA
jgi:hypothetical protein